MAAYSATPSGNARHGYDGDKFFPGTPSKAVVATCFQPP